MFKSVAIPVVVRKHKEDGVQVHTQTRHVINKNYDPLYDNTEETCGETLEDGESIIHAAIRGCEEELGSPNLFLIIKEIIGAQGEAFSTRPEDKILGLKPYYFVQQLIGPQPWIGLGFVVIIPDDFELQQDTEGKTSAHQWWNPVDLLKELQENPSNFMGLHYPVLLQVCKDIIKGKITI